MLEFVPHFRQLMSFESAARNNSFTKAAKELGLTHSAVSQNVKALEKQLGVCLIERTTHKVRLTGIGELYYAEIFHALTIISDSSCRLKTHENTFTLNMPTSFATRWFNNRLDGFLSENPKLELRLTSIRRKITTSDFDRDSIDASIEFGRNLEWNNCRYNKLLQSKLVLVGNPKFLGFKDNVNFFDKLPCIIVTHPKRKYDYLIWSKAAGIKEPPVENHIYYTGTPHALSAVVEGDGVLVTEKIIVEDALDIGLLVKISDFEVETDEAYYFVTPLYHANIVYIDKFRQWLQNALKNY